jgi:hypothetical protein
MTELHSSADLRSIRNSTGNEIRLTSVASNNHNILGSIENHTTAVDIKINAGRKSLRSVWLETAVIPVNLNLRQSELRHVFTCRESELDLLSVRARLVKKEG